MKFSKQRFFQLLSIAFIIITGLVNLFGYFNLPDQVASHFSFTGEVTSYMSTPIYLVMSFALVTVLSFGILSKDGSQKIKYIFADTIIFIANIVCIFLQIK